MCIRKEKETKKELKKNEKNQTIYQGSYPFSEKNFKDFSRLRFIFPGPVVFFFQDFLVLENVKIKLQDFPGFQDPYEPRLTKCRSWHWSTFNPFLIPFFPGGGGARLLKSQTDIQMVAFSRPSVSKAKRDGIGGVKKWGKLGSVCDSTQTSLVFRSAATKSIANCVNTQAKSCQVVVSNLDTFYFFSLLLLLILLLSSIFFRKCSLR